MRLLNEKPFRIKTLSQLIAHAELKLGRSCFRVSACQDTFDRDIRIVKKPLQPAGSTLLYSRNKSQPGYYVRDQPALSPDFKQTLKSNLDEVDQYQIDIYQKLSPSDRFSQGCFMSDTPRKVVAYRLREENPKLSVVEVNRMALQRAYRS